MRIDVASKLIKFVSKIEILNPKAFKIGNLKWDFSKLVTICECCSNLTNVGKSN